MMKIENQHLAVDVQSLGGALVNARFSLPSGQVVSPFFNNPWRNESNSLRDELPDMLRDLGAEWPCVPFGTAGLRPDLPDAWQLGGVTNDWDDLAHGYGSHNHWQLNKTSPTEISAKITYPGNHPIEGLSRKIWLDVECAKIHFSLRIHARHSTRMPVGLHPIFDLSEYQNERCRLRIGGAGDAWTLPVELEPSSVFVPDQHGVDINNIARRNGGHIDARMLPFSTKSEDLLMLTNPGGQVSLDFLDKGYSINVNWDAAALPSCVLWYSMGGRDYYPWNGRVRAIGIEPVAAAFDLGVSYSQTKVSPLTKSGVATGVDLLAGETWTTEYSISLEGL